MKVERHAQERPAVAVAVGRVEIKIVLAIGHHAALIVDSQRMVVVAHHRALPLRAPGRRAGRHWPESDWSSGRTRSRDAAAADEPFLAMVKAPGVEVVNHHGQRACGHERIHPRPFIEEHRGATADLIGVVAADHALASYRVVRPADARPQHQVDVAERIGSKGRAGTDGCVSSTKGCRSIEAMGAMSRMKSKLSLS